MPDALTRNSRWRIFGSPEIYPVEFRLAHEQVLADELTDQPTRRSLVIWRCKPSLLVTRTEMRLPHIEHVSAELRAAGWPLVLRKSGGAACPVGPGTVQLSMIEAAKCDATLAEKYRALAQLMKAVLCLYRIPAEIRLVAGAYCPGSYDLAVQSRKIAGMSQHWFRNRGGTRCIVTAASINIEEPPDMLAAVVNRFYDRAGGPFRCNAESLTNMRLCGARAVAPDDDLAAAVIGQIASRTGMLG